MRGITQRPPVLRKTPSLPRGPKWEQSLRKNAKTLSGPGNPPVGFVTGTTSAVEWICYWALCKVLDPQRDPRSAPFYGREGLFRYQKAFEGGRERGGQVIDFVVFPNEKLSRQIAIRIQTVFFHNAASQTQQSDDRLRKVRIASVMQVVDIYDTDLLESNGTAGTGEKAVIAVKRALGLIESPNPVATGQVRNVQYRLNRS